MPGQSHGAGWGALPAPARPSCGGERDLRRSARTASADGRPTAFHSTVVGEGPRPCELVTAFTHGGRCLRPSSPRPSAMRRGNERSPRARPMAEGTRQNGRAGPDAAADGDGSARPWTIHRPALSTQAAGRTTLPWGIPEIGDHLAEMADGPRRTAAIGDKREITSSTLDFIADRHRFAGRTAELRSGCRAHPSHAPWIRVPQGDLSRARSVPLMPSYHAHLTSPRSLAGEPGGAGERTGSTAWPVVDHVGGGLDKARRDGLLTLACALRICSPHCRGATVYDCWEGGSREPSPPRVWRGSRSEGMRAHEAKFNERQPRRRDRNSCARADSRGRASSAESVPGAARGRGRLR